MSIAPWNLLYRDWPTREVLDLIRGRWTVLVLVALHAGPRRFTALAHDIQGITPKMLTQTLRDLERDGLVQRTIFIDDVPPRAEYSLTEVGHTLRDVIEVLGSWGGQHMVAVRAARERSDEQQALRSGGAAPSWWRKPT